MCWTDSENLLLVTISDSICLDFCVNSFVNDSKYLWYDIMTHSLTQLHVGTVSSFLTGKKKTGTYTEAPIQGSVGKLAHDASKTADCTKSLNISADFSWDLSVFLNVWRTVICGGSTAPYGDGCEEHHGGHVVQKGGENSSDETQDDDHRPHSPSG